MAKKKTILDLQKMKETGEQAAWMVIYDACMASFAEEAGMDMILVGDSMGMIVYGWDGTVPVTIQSLRESSDRMPHHICAIKHNLFVNQHCLFAISLP